MYKNFHNNLILMLANSFNGQKEKLVKLYMHTVTVHWQPINNVNESRKMNLSNGNQFFYFVPIGF